MHGFLDEQPATVDNPYRRAKVEHYMERAEELARMARYQAARKTLASVFALDLDYPPAIELQRFLDETIATLLRSATALSYVVNGSTRMVRRKEVILVVDQDERILTTMAQKLRAYGFSAVGASGFNEAIEALQSFKPHLIVSEVNFENGPVGYDLYLWIRHNEEFKDIPFLYLATRVTREMLIAGKRMGVDEFIVKPLDEEVMMASILQCLARQKRKKTTV